LPGAVFAVGADADVVVRGGQAREASSRVEADLDAARCLAAVAWVPVTCANGSEVVGDDGCSIRYEEPAATGTLKRGRW